MRQKWVAGQLADHWWN